MSGHSTSHPDIRAAGINQRRLAGERDVDIAANLGLTPRSLRRIAGPRSAAVSPEPAQAGDDPPPSDSATHGANGRATAATERGGRASVLMFGGPAAPGVEYRFRHRGEGSGLGPERVIGETDEQGRILTGSSTITAPERHAVADYYSDRETADRQARARGAVGYIEEDPDGDVEVSGVLYAWRDL